MLTGISFGCSMKTENTTTENSITVMFHVQNSLKQGSDSYTALEYDISLSKPGEGFQASAMMQFRPSLFLVCLTLEHGTNMFSQNIGDQLPAYAV
jgi:hypothetical protein